MEAETMSHRRACVVWLLLALLAWFSVIGFVAFAGFLAGFVHLS